MEQSPRLILGSSSATRYQLLSRLQIPFVTISPNIDESPKKDESAIDLSERLAKEKAQAIFTKTSLALPLITSDQVMLLKGEILGKPRNTEHAIQIIHQCSGQTAEFYTSLTVTNTATNQQLIHTEKTTVEYRQYDRSVAERYVAIEKPLNAAGAIHCEGLGISLLSNIHSNDPTALLGLPLIALSEMLRQVGVTVL